MNKNISTSYMFLSHVYCIYYFQTDLTFSYQYSANKRHSVKTTN